MHDRIQIRTRYINEFRYIVLNKCEIIIIGQVGQIFRTACDEIIHPNHLVTLQKQSITKMRS